MSIINEALKRAAQESGRQVRSQIEIPSAEVIVLEKGDAKGRFFIFGALILLLLGSGVYFFINPESNSVIPQSEIRNPESNSVIPQSEIRNPESNRVIPQSTIRKPKFRLPSLELTGIMMEEPPQALVNGQFLEVGRVIEGIKVVKIAANYVTFKYRGRKFKKWLD